MKEEFCLTPNRVLVLKNGLTSQVMGGKSRKRVEKFNLHHEH